MNNTGNTYFVNRRGKILRIAIISMDIWKLPKILSHTFFNNSFTFCSTLNLIIIIYHKRIHKTRKRLVFQIIHGRVNKLVGTRHLDDDRGYPYRNINRIFCRLIFLLYVEFSIIFSVKRILVECDLFFKNINPCDLSFANTCLETDNFSQKAGFKSLRGTLLRRNRILVSIWYICIFLIESLWVKHSM